MAKKTPPKKAKKMPAKAPMRLPNEPDDTGWPPRDIAPVKRGKK